MINNHNKLSEIAQINPSIKKNNTIDPDLRISFIPMAAVSERSCSITYEEEKILKDVIKSYTYFERGDIILAKITPCFENGKLALTYNLKNQYGFGSSEFHVIRPDVSKLDPAYLFFFLRTKSFRYLGESKMTGSAGQKRVPKHFLESLDLFVPSLKEQQRIAAVLSAADALCQKRRDTLAWLEQLVQSTFYEMFGDPLENPKGWPVVQVSDFVANFESGKSITASNLQEETDYKVLKISAVTGNSFNLSETKPLPQDYIPPQHHLVQQGDLLFSRANTSELVGATAYVFETEPNIALPDKIWRFKWKEPKIVSPLYCWILFSNPFIQNQIANNASGSSGSMKNISQAKMMQMQVICPPLELQNRFETALLEIYARQKAYQESLQNLEALFDSLMYHAFQGHLVFSEEGIEKLMAQMQAEAA